MVKTAPVDAFKELADRLRRAALRPSIGAYKPLPHQEVFHKSTSKGKLFIGGNRSGKTVGGATESIWWLTGKHPYRPTPEPPVYGRAISVDFLNGVEKIIKPEIQRWIPQSFLINGSWEKSYSKEMKTLTLNNGSTLEFMSLDQDLDKFAGTSRHFCWFDEEPDYPIFLENRLRLLDTGGSYWITMTPVEGMTWIYDEIYLKSRIDQNILTVEVDTEQNTFLSIVEIEELFSSMSDEDREARKRGKFIQIGGLIYKMFRPELHIIESVIYGEKWDSFKKSNWMHFAMMDHGFNNPTCWLWGCVNSEGVIVIYDEHYASGMVVKDHAKVVAERELSLGCDFVYRVGDPSIRNTDPLTGTSVHQEYAEHGIPIVLGNNDVPAGINRVITRLNGNKGKPQLFITKNCEHLIYEMGRYRWAKWEHKKANFNNNKKEVPHKKDDHACDALRYGIASRPEVEDGTLIMPTRDVATAYPAVGKLYDYDRPLQSSSNYVDTHLGDEY